jgi:hypothetical protein
MNNHQLIAVEKNGEATRKPVDGTPFTSIAAMGSVLAAVSCCLPLSPFLVAAGAAGSSAFLAAARPYLLGISVLCVVYGFYHTGRARQCQRKPSLLSRILLWTATAVVIAAIFFPQVMANAAADLLAR